MTTKDDNSFYDHTRFKHTKGNDETKMTNNNDEMWQKLRNRNDEMMTI